MERLAPEDDSPTAGGGSTRRGRLKPTRRAAALPIGDGGGDVWLADVERGTTRTGA